MSKKLNYLLEHYRTMFELKILLNINYKKYVMCNCAIFRYNIMFILVITFILLFEPTKF